MNSKEARRQIAEIVKNLEAQSWLLEKSNHSRHPQVAYAHHVRDRLSESMVSDLEAAISKLRQLAEAIGKGITEPTPAEEDSDEIPF